MTNVPSGSKRPWEGGNDSDTRKRARDDSRDWRDVHLSSPRGKPLSEGRDSADRRRNDYHAHSRDHDHRRSSDHGRDRRDERDRRRDRSRDRERDRERDYYSRRDDSRREDGRRRSRSRSGGPRHSNGHVNGHAPVTKDESEKEEGE